MTLALNEKEKDVQKDLGDEERKAPSPISRRVPCQPVIEVEKGRVGHSEPETSASFKQPPKQRNTRAKAKDNKQTNKKREPSSTLLRNRMFERRSKAKARRKKQGTAAASVRHDGATTQNPAEDLQRGATTPIFLTDNAPDDTLSSFNCQVCRRDNRSPCMEGLLRGSILPEANRNQIRVGAAMFSAFFFFRTKVAGPFS